VASVPRGKQVRLWNSGQRWKLFDWAPPRWAEYGFPYLMLHHADLHAVLVDSGARAGCLPASISARHAPTSRRNAHGVTLHLANGRVAPCDVFVAADGVHCWCAPSSVMPISPSSPACAACARTDHYGRAARAPARAARTNWIGPGGHVITYPVRRGELLNFVGIREGRCPGCASPGANAETRGRQCAADFRGWHEDVQELIAAAGCAVTAGR
jgi:salicylate hydroxylase